jgi:3-dehydroquinate dehydratase-1
MLKVRDIHIGEGMPKIIVPLTGETEESLNAEVKLINELSPDIVEWRADKFKNIKDIDKVRNILHKLSGQLLNIPLLFTFRTIKEGGDTAIKEEEYVELVQAVMESGNIDMVDVEYTLTKARRDQLIKEAKKLQIYIVMSIHHFAATPEKDAITSALIRMIDEGADIPKIAVMPNNKDDVLTLLQATYTVKKKYPHQPLITMAMGKYGLISRLGGEVFGSDATFAAGKEASAPGQIAVSDLRKVLKVIHQNS